VNTVNSYANDAEQPLPSSSSSSIFADTKSFGSKKKEGRSFWNTISKQGFDVWKWLQHVTFYCVIQNYENTDNQSDSSQTKFAAKRTWKKSPLVIFSNCCDIQDIF